MRHLITEPRDGFSVEASQADWDDYRDYLDTIGWEEEQAEMAFEEANRELAAIESPM